MHSELEEHVQQAYCPKCRKKSSATWSSEFHGDTHYRRQDCSHCDYEIFFIESFLSDGKS